MTEFIFPVWPLKAVDIVGSAGMILLSLLCVRQARLLRREDPRSVIRTYLYGLTLALLLFSVSRSVSHLVKYLLVHTGHGEEWIALRPLTGSLNTISFVIVGAITLFFRKVHSIYRQTVEDKYAIEQAHSEIVQLNENLERRVLARTRELAKSEEKYRRVFEGSKDMLVILNPGGCILDLNRAGVEMLEADSEESLIGRNLFREFFLEPSCADVLEALSHRDFVKDMEVRIRRSGGEELQALFSATVRSGDGGSASGFEGTLKDITLRRLMATQLQQAEKLASLGQLSAGVAHEINNPLGLILGYTQLILKEADEGTQAYEDLKVIEKHTMSCKKIVEDLLQFSRSTETTKKPSNVNELLGDVLRVLRSNFAKDGVEIDESLSPDLPELTLDGEKMEQVFMNLLINARQAIEGAGAIRVSTAVTEGPLPVVITVSDSGCGIPPEVKPRIFDPFYTTKPTGKGTGLGLSVSYGIVQDHGGEIDVVSTPGQGAVFTVRLPQNTSVKTGEPDP